MADGGGNGVPLGPGSAVYDADLYGGGDRGGYNTTAVDDDDADDQLDVL